MDNIYWIIGAILVLIVLLAFCVIFRLLTQLHNEEDPLLLSDNVEPSESSKLLHDANKNHFAKPLKLGQQVKKDEYVKMKFNVKNNEPEYYAQSVVSRLRAINGFEDMIVQKEEINLISENEAAVTIFLNDEGGNYKENPAMKEAMALLQGDEGSVTIQSSTNSVSIDMTRQRSSITIIE